MIDFLNYNKTYGFHTVLCIPELSLPGGIHWIKGKNGSGKSTLLKSIAGIIPFEGEICINGYNLKQNPLTGRRKVTYSEAEPIFPDFLTASEIIGFAAETRRIGKVDVEEVIEYFGVHIFQNQATGGYSAGMLKKLSLCMAFLGNIPWILLDEPFAFLDKETEGKLIERINRKKQGETNFIITSHHELDRHMIDFDGIYSISNTQLNTVQ